MAAPSENQLLKAAGVGDLATLERLFTGQGSFDMTDAEGKSALHLAAFEGQLAAVQWLLGKGFAVDAKTKKGEGVER
jgi:hypothetical protein